MEHVVTAEMPRLRSDVLCPGDIVVLEYGRSWRYYLLLGEVADVALGGSGSVVLWWTLMCRCVGAQDGQHVVVVTQRGESWLTAEPKHHLRRRSP